MTDRPRSVFGPVDQEAILANIDVVDDEDVDSDFLVAEMARHVGGIPGKQVDDQPAAGSAPGLVNPTPAMRRAFVLYGPAGLVA